MVHPYDAAMHRRWYIQTRYTHIYVRSILLAAHWGDWHTNWNKRTDDTEKLNDKTVMVKEWEQKKQKRWKGAQTVRTELQTIETIIAHRRRRWWIKRGTISAPLYLLSLIFPSLLFLSTVPLVATPYRTVFLFPLIVTRFAFISPFRLFNSDIRHTSCIIRSTRIIEHV